MKSPYPHHTPSPVNSILRSHSCTLEKLLDLPEMICEIQFNSKLQQYLSEEKILTQLFNHICTSNDKYQLSATKIVCMEIMIITENIFCFPF